jgi:hypothetical protein
MVLLSHERGGWYHTVSGEQHYGCSICGLNHPFEMPQELIEAALSGKLVVFAGAGVSSESRRVFSDTFAEVIASKVGLDAHEEQFPDLMTAYETKYGRAQLLQEIRQRFDYMKAFPDLLDLATHFHSELSTAYFLDQIVTTNWIRTSRTMQQRRRSLSLTTTPSGNFKAGRCSSFTVPCTTSARSWPPLMITIAATGAFGLASSAAP